MMHRYSAVVVLALGLAAVVVPALGPGASAPFARAGDAGPIRAYLPYVHNACGQERELCLSAEREPNDAREAAYCLPQLCEGVAASGSIGAGDARDIFRFSLPVTRTVRLELDLARLSAGATLGFAVYEHHSGQRVEQGRQVGPRRVIQRALAAGTYYLAVFPPEGLPPPAEPYSVRWVAAEAPAAIAPADESTVFAADRRVVFDWTPVLADRYQLQLHNAYDGRNPSRRWTFEAAEPPFTSPPLPFNGEYWWQVQALGEGSVAIASGERMFTLCDRVVVRDVVAAGGGRYDLRCAIDVDMRYYTDRSRYRITRLPAALAGLPWIATANNDADATDERFLSFTAIRPIELFVAYDARATARPSWLDAFTKTDLTIDVSDDDMGAFEVFSRTFPAGPVVLGANMAVPAAGAGSNYLVVIRPLP